MKDGGGRREVVHCCDVGGDVGWEREAETVRRGAEQARRKTSERRQERTYDVRRFIALTCFLVVKKLSTKACARVFLVNRHLLLDAVTQRRRATVFHSSPDERSLRKLPLDFPQLVPSNYDSLFMKPLIPFNH